MDDGALRALEKRLGALEDREEIRRTLHQYAHYLDKQDRSDENMSVWADVFTEDGVWRSETLGSYGGTSRLNTKGRTAIKEWMKTLIPDVPLAQRRIKQHVVAVTNIQLDGDRATTESYFTAFHATPEGPLVNAFGRFFDTLVRCPDGRWRIKDRRLSRESIQQSLQGRGY